MFDCTRCVHRRGSISENGFHYVCGLSWQSARNCILGKKKHYEEIPKYQWIEKRTDKEEVWDVIHELSDIRAQYSIFDEEEYKKHHACSLAIKALREVIGE